METRYGWPRGSKKGGVQSLLYMHVRPYNGEVWREEGERMGNVLSSKCLGWGDQSSRELKASIGRNCVEQFLFQSVFVFIIWELQ